MPKAVRLFLNDDIKLNVSTDIPGTQIDTRVIHVQGANINVIDLSKRLDIESIHLQLKMKMGVKPYESESGIIKELPIDLPEKKKENIIHRLFKRGKS